MKTVGMLLKEARLVKGYQLSELGEETRIKATFIQAIERGNWEKLPEFGIVTGFVKNLAHFLEVDERQMVSTLRRDYPASPKGSVGQAHQPIRGEFGRKVVWGPRLTFLAGVAIIVISVLGYLGFQYRGFNSAPHLTVDAPIEGQTVTEPTLQVIGQADQDATVEVNNQPVVVGEDGKFTASIDVAKNTTEVQIVAKSRSGKETGISRRIEVKL